MTLISYLLVGVIFYIIGENIGEAKGSLEYYDRGWKDCKDLMNKIDKQRPKNIILRNLTEEQKD